MVKTKEISHLSIEDLNNLIEQKILEILGDPDYGLELREDFKREIVRRLRQKSKRVSHEEVIKKFG
jgi:hypothetical protein